MQTTLSRPRLAVAFWCHLPRISIKLPHVEIDREQFPSAGEGFDDFAMAETSWYFGGKYALVDISGRTKQEVQEDLKARFSAGLAVEPIRFLQCLEYVRRRQEDGLTVPPTFERIVAYLDYKRPPVCAEPDGKRFKRVEAPNAETPWKSGTFGMFYIDEL